MKKVNLIFGVLCFIFGCGKDDEKKHAYPLELYSVTYKNTSKVRLFAKGKEITDQTVIKNFINTHKYGVFAINDVTLSLNRVDTIVFLSKDKLALRTINPYRSFNLITPGYTNYPIVYCLYDHNRQQVYCDSTGYKKAIAYKSFSVQRDQEKIIFIPKDTGLYTVTKEAELTGIPMYKFKPSYLGAPIPGGYNTGQGDMYKIVYGKFAFGNEDWLEFPLLSYAFTTSTKYSGLSVAKGFINNQFDEECLSLLKDRDTLAIQEFRILYHK